MRVDFPEGTQHWTIGCPLVTMFQGQLVILSSPGAQWKWTILRVLSTLNNMISTGDSISWPTGDIEFPWVTMGVNYSSSALNIEQYDINWWQYFMANWWYWVPLGHNGSELFPEGTQHWTIWSVHLWWYFIFNWRCWVPLGHNDDWPLNLVKNSPRNTKTTDFPRGTQHRTIWSVHLS